MDAIKKRKSDLGLLGEVVTHGICANILSQISASLMKSSPTESVPASSPVTCVCKRTGHRQSTMAVVEAAERLEKTSKKQICRRMYEMFTTCAIQHTYVKSIISTKLSHDIDNVH